MQKRMTRRGFFVSVAASPVPILVPSRLTPERGRVQSTVECSDESRYLGQPLVYWLRRLRQVGDDIADEEAGKALAHFGPAVLPHLIEALAGSPEHCGRAETANAAFKQMGPAAFPVLLDALDHANPIVCCRAADMLCRLDLGARLAPGTGKPRSRPPVGKAHAVLAAALRDGDARIRTLAAETAWFAHGTALVPELTKALMDHAVSVRKAAACALEERGDKASSALSALRGSLLDPEPWMRLYAARAISHIDEHQAGHVIPVLLDILKNHPIPSGELRADEAAAEVLDSIPAGLSALEDAFDEGSVRMRLAVVESLLYRQAEARGLLLRALNDGSPAVRRAAACKLRDSLSRRAPAGGVKATLEHVLAHDPSTAVRLAAAAALARHEPRCEPAIAALLSGLKHPSLPIRRDAVRGFQGIDPPVTGAVPDLVRLVKESRLRRNVFCVLQYFGADARLALPATLEILQEQEADELLLPISRMLGGIGRESIERVRPLLKKAAADVRCRILRLFGHMAWQLEREEQSCAVAAVIPLAGDPEVRVRAVAVECLGRFHYCEAEATRALRKAGQDRDLAVRSNAAEALKALCQQRGAVTWTVVCAKATGARQ